MPGPRLRAEEVAVGWAGEPLLAGLHLEVEPGRPWALLGPSGCGKTTLLGVLAGVRPPLAGVVRLDGRDLGELGARGREALRRGRLALLSQDLDLLPALSAERNAALTGLLAGLGVAEALRRARVELEALGLGAVLQRPARALSRGQRQRVALARALAHPGDLLLLDEPSTALDEAARGVLLARLAERAAAGDTLVLATHDPVVAAWAPARARVVGARVEAA